MKKLKTAVELIKKYNMLPTQDKKPVIEIYSDNRVFIEGCSCVTEYTDCTICFCSNNVNVRISGDGLKISHLNYDKSVISGKIISVELL